MSRAEVGTTQAMTMDDTGSPSLAAFLGRGVVAGLVGTVVMTAFQELAEKPVTGRGDSYAPADFAEAVTPIEAHDPRSRTALNWATHFALGAMWGAAFGVAGHAGLRGQKAVGAVFATVYGGDVLLNTALGLYQPSTWSAKEVAVDVMDKLVQAQATGVVFDRIRPS